MHEEIPVKFKAWVERINWREPFRLDKVFYRVYVRGDGLGAQEALKLQNSFNAVLQHVEDYFDADPEAETRFGIIDVEDQFEFIISRVVDTLRKATPVDAYRRLVTHAISARLGDLEAVTDKILAEIHDAAGFVETEDDSEGDYNG